MHLQKHIEREERRPAPRSRRNEPVVIGPSPLDEVIRRNREDELNLVLKEARDCRMYGICPGR
ncbi:MAG: hypothetical protein EOP11_15730 [Proteobacteria bacterium]|nr:MAG: hypothetical protein EOP11_15730 [Pseudomonadota bacterium]